MEYAGLTGNSSDTVHYKTSSADAANCSNFLMICIGNFSDIRPMSACDVSSNIKSKQFLILFYIDY